MADVLSNPTTSHCITFFLVSTQEAPCCSTPSGHSHTTYQDVRPLYTPHITLLIRMPQVWSQLAEQTPANVFPTLFIRKGLFFYVVGPYSISNTCVHLTINTPSFYLLHLPGFGGSHEITPPVSKIILLASNIAHNFFLVSKSLKWPDKSHQLLHSWT